MRVINAVPLNRYCARFTFSDGKSFELDLEPLFAGASGWLYDGITTPEGFRSMRLNSITVEWPTGLDICPDGLRRWCEQGKISESELDEVATPPCQ